MKKSKNEKLKEFVRECKTYESSYCKISLIYDYAPDSDLCFAIKEELIDTIKYYSENYNYGSMDREKIFDEFLRDYAFGFKALEDFTFGSKREENRFAYSNGELINFIKNYAGDLNEKYI